MASFSTIVKVAAVIAFYAILIGTPVTLFVLTAHANQAMHAVHIHATQNNNNVNNNTSQNTNTNNNSQEQNVSQNANPAINISNQSSPNMSNTNQVSINTPSVVQVTVAPVAVASQLPSTGAGTNILLALISSFFIGFIFHKASRLTI